MALSVARRRQRLHTLAHHFHSPRRSLASSAAAAAPSGMPAMAQFEFDLNGYCIVPSVFSPAEVAAANAGIDAHLSERYERRDSLRNTRSDTVMAGDGKTGRLDLGRCLEWPSPHSDVFRDVLAHPKLLPYFLALLGPGYRMDHLPLVLAQTQGSEGFQLHGGVTAPVSGAFQPHLEYSWRNGTMHNMLLGCTLQLVDHDEGDGGFCVVCEKLRVPPCRANFASSMLSACYVLPACLQVKGSHKANVAMPEEMVHGSAGTEHVYQPTTKAGDVILFSEAATVRKTGETAGVVGGGQPATLCCCCCCCWHECASQPPPLVYSIASVSSATQHGSLPWTRADKERRVALFRFAPATVAYGRNYSADATASWPAAMYEGLTEAQAAVLQPPYAGRLDRVLVHPDPVSGAPVVSVQERAPERKDFDRKVLGQTTIGL